MKNRILSMALVVTLFVPGCSTGPEPIVSGRDQCAHCRMAISDVRFAAQYVSDKGKRSTFDSIECLVKNIGEMHPTISSAWVADYEMSDTWLPVERAVYVHSEIIHSPMGAGLAAFGPPATVAEIHQTYGGTVMTWPEVRAWVHRGHDPVPTAPSHESAEAASD